MGCMVDSCRACSACREGLEQYCEGERGFTGTYNGPAFGGGENTYGGYAETIVVDNDGLRAAREPCRRRFGRRGAAAVRGLTTYSPLRQWGAGPGKKVGIVGLGGLGHMGVKIAHAMGARVVLFTTSPGKTEDAKRLGADEVAISKDPDQMAAHAGSFDLIVDTVAAPHDLDVLLKRDATLVVGKQPAKSWLSCRRLNGDDPAHERGNGHDGRNKCATASALRKRLSKSCVRAAILRLAASLQ